MKRVGRALGAICLSALTSGGFAAAPRFEKLGGHCYFFQPPSGGTNVGAVVTAGGVLLINPPAPPELASVLEALRRLTPKTATWVVNTDYQLERIGGSAQLSAQDATVLSSNEQRQLGSPAAKTDAKDAPPARKDEKPASAVNSRAEPAPRFFFTRQMRLFPDDLEIRIVALSARARTSGDIVVFVPAEKVLFTGNLFRPDSFPEIDRIDGGGTALGWIDGMKRVVELVPLLKSAMPQPKPDPGKPPQEEKSPEEQVLVVPGTGVRSNLRELKDVLEAAQKLRNEIAKSISSGRTRDNFLSTPAIGQYRDYNNFEPFANQLYDELAEQKSK